MPKKDEKGEKGEDSDSSQSSAHDEDGQLTARCSRKPLDEKRGRGSGQKKRPLTSLCATSSGNVPQSSPLRRIDFHDEGVGSPSKRPCAEEKRKLYTRCDAEDRSSEEDSNPALNYPLKNLELGVEESTGVEPNELQPPSDPSVAERVGSAAEFEQSPKMSRLSVPVQSSEVHPTSPSKVKAYFDRTKKRLGNVFRKASPKKEEKDVGSSSEKADLKLKHKSYSNIGSPKGKSPNLNPAKSEASSSSGSPVSKKNSDSSTDKSLPSSSAKDTNVVESSPATKIPNISKNTGSPRVSTGDPSQPGTSQRLDVPPSGTSPNRSGTARSPISPSRSPSKSKKSPRHTSLSPCTCSPKKKKKDDHDLGCSYSASRQRKKNNINCLNTFDPKRSTDSSGTASDPNVESSPATKSPSKSKNTGSPRVSTGDPSQPGTSQCLYVPPSGNSPNRCDEAARSPNRRSPSRSPSPITSQRSPRQPSPRPCNCSPWKKRHGQHNDDCPFWSPSRQR